MKPDNAFKRPGVSDEFLILAGCDHVGGDECVERFGFRAEGIAIPFRRLDGEPITEQGKPFARIRLYTPTESQKYHQRSGSNVHIYIPHNFRDLPRGATLFITEGEFKTMSLVESGFAAIGLCGINGAMQNADGEARLHPELAEVLDFHKPARVVFIGDNDTVLNSEFSREVSKLRQHLFASKRFPFIRDFSVGVCPLDGPKGIDDVRAATGDHFKTWFDSLVELAFLVPAKATPAEIFCALLRRESERVRTAVKGDSHDAHCNMVKLLQSAGRLQHETGAMLKLKPLMADILNVKETAIGTMIKDAGNDTKARKRKLPKLIPGQDGQSAATPSQWFAQKFPSLVDEFGDAVLEETGEEGIVSARDIGEDFLAATLGEKANPNAPTVFVPTEEKFYTYRPDEGIFLPQQEPALLARLSRDLLDCARACKGNCETKSLEFRFRDAANLSGVLRKARGLLEVPHDFFSTDLTEFIPCANGMLRLSDKEPLAFSPSYRRRNKLAVPFDSSAKCPLFLDTLMRPALDPDELDLLQRWFGLALIGENLAQKIVILTGTAGGGKGTFIRVLNGIIGQTNLATLRPQLLGERFELGRFLGKTLLYGADVPENFLNQRGASILKSLTGGDPVTLEFKNSNESPSITCCFNVIVTCNSRLTVHLEGDTDAWRRRLVPIPYEKPKPERVIHDLGQRILATEASGVLNFALEGLDKLRADNWQLRMTARQQAAVDNLLLESDGHTLFVREALVRVSGERLTVADCFAAYVAFCNQRGWTAVTRKKFGDVIGDAVTRAYGLTVRHDIRDANGKEQRGWNGLRLCEKIPQPSGRSPSEASENGVSDRADGVISVQPEKIAEVEQEALRI